MIDPNFAPPTQDTFIIKRSEAYLWNLKELKGYDIKVVGDELHVSKTGVEVELRTSNLRTRITV